MIAPPQLIEPFESNHWLAGRLLEGLSHDESLLLPNFQTNALNWILGHIVVGRQNALKTLAQPALFSDAETKLYETDSAPISVEAALPLQTLRDKFDQSQEALVASIAASSEELLSKIVSTPFGDQPRWKWISGLSWHETYHIGQFELLRQLALDSRG